MHLLISLESWQGYRTLKSRERERRQGGLSLSHGSAVYEQGTSVRFVVVVFLTLVKPWFTHWLTGEHFLPFRIFARV